MTPVKQCRTAYDSCVSTRAEHVRKARHTSQYEIELRLFNRRLHSSGRGHLCCNTDNQIPHSFSAPYCAYAAQATNRPFNATPSSWRVCDGALEYLGNVVIPEKVALFLISVSLAQCHSVSLPRVIAVAIQTRTQGMWSTPAR